MFVSRNPSLPRVNGRRRGFSLLGILWLFCFGALGLWLLSSGSRQETIGATAEASPIVSRPVSRCKKIEDVRVGDYVLAKDPGDGGDPTPHAVIGLPRNYTFHVATVAIDPSGSRSDAIEATREHPFFTQNRGWVSARDLLMGDTLVDAAGSPVRVHTSEIKDRFAYTFNLTVEHVHTFYVRAGSHYILVHNADAPGGENPYPDPQQPKYNNGAVQMDHEDARVWGGTSANRPLPAETNMRRGGFDGKLYQDYKKLIAQGMSEADARTAVQSEIDSLKNSPPPRPMDPHVMDRLPAKGPCQ